MNSLGRMGPYLRPYRWTLFWGFFTVVLPVLMELVVPRMLQYIIDDGIRDGSMAVVWRGAGIMLGAALLGATMTLAQGLCRARVSQGLAFDLRSDLFRHIQSLSFANFDQMQTGQMMTRIASDANTVRMFFSAGIALLLRATLMITGSLIMLFLTDWQLTLIVLVALALAAVVIRTLMQVAQPIFHTVQRKLGALNTIVQENLAGVRVVKAYVRERHESERFAQSNVDYMEQNIRVGRLLATALPALALITNITLVLVLWRGGIDTINGRLSVGELVAFNNYLLIGMSPLLLLSNLLTMVARANVSVERVYDVLETEPRLRAADNPQRATNTERAGEIIFDNVSFHYDSRLDEEKSQVDIERGGRETPHVNGSAPGRNGHGVRHVNGAAPREAVDQYGLGDEAVLRGVSFVVQPGQQVALMGATGSGKSTLTSLIPRFYDATDGRVMVNGVDVRDWSPAALRRQIGLVMQQPRLFQGTVRENIAYGDEEASMEAVVAAAQAAQAHDFIMAMPEGYESRVEAQGSNLSGGQKQRIAIARALLIAPSILILDDSTSAVDFETEVRIQDALDELMRNRTTLIVAQRISSVLNADQILVLDAGQVAARGNHEELLESSEMYREIYESQMGA